MTQKSNETLIDAFYSNGPKKKDATNKREFYYINDIWSLDVLDLKDYGSESSRNYRYVLVIFDNLSKFGWTVLFKNKKAQTIKDSFEKIITRSTRKPSLFGTDHGKGFFDNIFQKFLINNNIKHFSR